MAKKKGKTTLADQLREYARKCSLRPAEICRQTGIKPSLMSQFLGGHKFLGVENMNALAEVLGLELTERRRNGKS